MSLEISARRGKLVVQWTRYTSCSIAGFTLLGVVLLTELIKGSDFSPYILHSNEIINRGLACARMQSIKRSGHLCPRCMNTSDKNISSKHDTLRRNVTTSVLGLKTVTDKKLKMFFGCLTSQQHVSVSQGWIRSDNLRAATLR